MLYEMVVIHQVKTPSNSVLTYRWAYSTLHRCPNLRLTVLLSNIPKVQYIIIQNPLLLFFFCQKDIMMLISANDDEINSTRGYTLRLVGGIIFNLLNKLVLLSQLWNLNLLLFSWQNKKQNEWRNLHMSFHLQVKQDLLVSLFCDSHVIINVGKNNSYSNERRHIRTSHNVIKNLI